MLHLPHEVSARCGDVGRKRFEHAHLVLQLSDAVDEVLFANAHIVQHLLGAS